MMPGYHRMWDYRLIPGLILGALFLNAVFWGPGGLVIYLLDK